MGGYYNLLTIENDEVNVYNSITRTEPVYYYENNKCITIGNRASLVFAMANKTLNFEYNLDALISMCTTGWPAHDLVPFKGVKLLDNGSKVSVENGRLNVGIYKPYQFDELDNISNIDEVYDDLCNEFIKGTKILKNFTSNITIGLTGGKDSRLAAALCKEAGIDFSCVTSGGELDRDVIVASEVAKILNVEHEYTMPKEIKEIPKVDIFEFLNRQIIQGEGLSSIYDPCYPVRTKASVQYAGHGGAIYKGGYDNIKGGRRPEIENEQMALRFVNNLNLHNSAKFLTKGAIKTQEKINQDIVNKFFSTNFPQSNFYDYMYTVYREGRGTGSSRQASAYGSFQNSPFLNDNAIIKGLKIPLELRVNHKLYFNVLLRLKPELAYHRFGDSRWKFEENGPEPGTSFEDWKKREPLPETPRLHQAKNWRMGYDTYLREQIKEYLLSDRNNEIFNIVSYSKLEKVLNEPPPTSMSVVKSIYGILGTAYLINNDWFKEYKKPSLFSKIKSFYKKV